MSTNYILCVLVLASVCILNLGSIEYSDLEAMGISCPSMVSCISIDSSNFTRRNCECDRECAIFNDCCVDARTRRASARNRRSSPVTCMQFGDDPNMGAYAIQTCSRNFAGPAEVQSKCQNQNNISDPLMAAPVTDTATRLTYRNIYCAECNNVVLEDLQSWLIRTDCAFASTLNVNNTFIWENIHYRPNLNKWGVTVGESFQSCNLLFENPEYLQNSLRLCRANVVSDCPRSWNRPAVKRECESYTAIMYTVDETVYRNPHCALCHGRPLNRISCDKGISPRKKKPFSFALLLDVNQSDGDVVGVSRPGGENCRADEKYDPYFKKCRAIVCAIPGYVMVNGKCKKP